MISIEEILYEQFSNLTIMDNTEYKAMIEKVVDIENQIIELIGIDNIQLIREYERATDEIASYDQKRLIAFILEVIRQIFCK